MQSMGSCQMLDKGLIQAYTTESDQMNLAPIGLSLRAAWALLLKKSFSLEYRFVVLDEINVATHCGSINYHRVREMLFLKPDNVHLLLSGRHAHPEVTEAATNVIEMLEIKYPFQKGIKARKGIEF